MLEPTRILGRQGQPIAWLAIISGRRSGRDFRLREVTDIGRDGARNQVILNDEAVSAQHARIRLENGRFVLYDLASSNGTLVNGKRVERQPLLDGDEIIIGKTRMVFKLV